MNGTNQRSKPICSGGQGNRNVIRGNPSRKPTRLRPQPITRKLTAGSRKMSVSSSLRNAAVTDLALAA